MATYMDLSVGRMWRVKQLFCCEWRALAPTSNTPSANLTPGVPRGVRTVSSATSAFTSPGRALIRNCNWSQAEDDLVVQLRASGHTVPAIAERLSSRSMGSVSTRIYQVLGPQGRVKIAKAPRQFSADDDTFLAKLTGYPSPRILSRFPGRKLDTLYKRTQRLQRPARSANFTPEEDTELCKLRDQDHLTWHEIAARMPSYPRDKLANRYGRITPLSARTHVRLRRDRDGTALSEVRRLRDSGLTWEEVAAKMPPFSKQMARNLYWHAAVIGTTEQPHQDRTVTIARSIARENAELVRLRALRVPWREIIKSFPGRELGHLQNRFAVLQMRSRESKKPKFSGSLLDQPATQPPQQNTVEP